MGSKIGFTYKDYGMEISSVSFDIVTMTAANFDATVTLIGNLSTAILGVQNENSLQSKRIMSADTFVSRAPASVQGTQRENKWLLELEDATTHKLSRHEVPQANLSLLAANSEYLDLSGNPGLAFKTAVEAVVKSPAGNAVNLVSVQFVGKRL